MLGVGCWNGRVGACGGLGFMEGSLDSFIWGVPRGAVGGKSFTVLRVRHLKRGRPRWKGQLD